MELHGTAAIRRAFPICAAGTARYGAPVMSAAEIIELIKKLPPEERAEVIAYARNGTFEQGERTIRHATDEEFDRAKKKVFTENRELLRRLAQ